MSNYHSALKRLWIRHNFTFGFLHALSMPRCLHAVSITCRFQSWWFTRCFLYTHIPYPHKRLYTRRFHYTRIQSSR